MQELCIAQVAQEFQRNTLTKVPAQYHGKLVHLLPLDLALELAGQAILDESYWERRSKARWTNCDVLKHGGSFKQLYFERNLQDTIEECALIHQTQMMCALKCALAASHSTLSGIPQTLANADSMQTSTRSMT